MKYVLATILLLNVGSVLAADVQAQRDIAYTEPKNERQTLDVYAPTKGKGHPIVFWIHGGGWVSGDKTNMHEKPQAFVDKGFVFVSTNYRFVPKATINQIASDMAKAIRWVHDHAKDYGGDPNTIFVMGHSAGAQLAALICTDERYLKAEGLSFSIIKGCVPVDGDTYDVRMRIASVEERGKKNYKWKFGDEKNQKDLSSVTHVAKDKKIPPFLILHVADSPATKPQSHRLFSVLQKAGVPSKAFPAEGKSHGTINSELGLPKDEPTKALFEFVTQTLKNDLTDKEILQGTWEYVSATRDGKPYKTPIGIRITFIGDNVTRKIGETTHKHKYEIDPNKNPKRVSLIAMKDGNEEVSTGIYSLKGDTLKWCFNLPGKPIPKTLASKEGDELTLSVLIRVKPEKE